MREQKDCVWRTPLDWAGQESNGSSGPQLSTFLVLWAPELSGTNCRGHHIVQTELSGDPRGITSSPLQIWWRLGETRMPSVAVVQGRLEAGDWLK